MVRNSIGLVILMVVVFLTGCGAGTDDRLDVNDGLRQACNSMTDPEILSVVVSAEADRLAGRTMEMEMQDGLALWGGGSPQYICLSAVIGQVYSSN